MIVSRSEWGARYGRGGALKGPLGEVVIHTEAGAVLPEDWKYLNGLPDLPEKQHMQAVERYHSVTRKWDGIGYSFFIDWDGTIFEGRGWLRSGAHTETRNFTAHAICFRGHGDLQPATEQQWAAARWLIGEGIRLGVVTPNPKITGHRNYSMKGKSCPGNLIYPHIGRLRGITGQDDGGFLMALSDAEQAEVLANSRKARDDAAAVRAWVEAGVPGFGVPPARDTVAALHWEVLGVPGTKGRPSLRQKMTDLRDSLARLYRSEMPGLKAGDPDAD